VGGQRPRRATGGPGVPAQPSLALERVASSLAF